MYKINIIEKTAIQIQEGTHPEFGISYLELEKRNTIEKEIGNIFFFQETIPNCEPKYWKADNGDVVEMSGMEKYFFDLKIDTEQKINNLSWIYSERPIRITIPISLCLIGGDYASYANDFKLLKKPYEIIGEDEFFRVYLKEVYISSGFSLKNGIITNNDLRLIIEQLPSYIFRNDNGTIRSI